MFTLYSGQVGRPGRRGQVIFSLIEKNKICKFWLYTVAKLDDQDEVDKWFYQSHWKK